MSDLDADTSWRDGLQIPGWIFEEFERSLGHVAELAQMIGKPAPPGSKTICLCCGRRLSTLTKRTGYACLVARLEHFHAVASLFRRFAKQCPSPDEYKAMYVRVMVPTRNLMGFLRHCVKCGAEFSVSSADAYANQKHCGADCAG
jgi:DNA-directed RNA polymerase subunit RPC12/RpoP